MKIKHIIITRFAFDDTKLQYALNILKKHLLKSLSIQTTKNFELVILEKPNLRLEDELLINLKKHYPFKINAFTKEQLEKYIINQKDFFDFIITSRIDYDDHIYKTVVEETQKRIDINYSVVLYGLKNGVTIIDGEVEAMFMSHNIKSYKNDGFFSVFLSCILNTKKKTKYI